MQITQSLAEFNLTKKNSYNHVTSAKLTGNYLCASRNQFWFHFLLVKKEQSVFQSLTFETQLQTTLYTGQAQADINFVKT